MNGPRKGRFGARRLLGEAGDFSNFVHDVVEALQKGLTRGAQGRILGVDHDVVEEAVDRAAKNGKCREHLLVFAGEYEQMLATLAVLRGPVDSFFDNVMVNAEDPALRATRQALLKRLYDVMNKVAEIARLAK